jgi:hypothetical protein
MTKKTTHYINNDDFLKALIEYKTLCEECKSLNKPEPAIPNYIGECFLKIADNLSRLHKFVSYSFKDEMISDGVENCLMYFRNFDPNKSKNPFAYFTQIIYYAFIRRITKEKKQMYIKYKATEQFGIFDEQEMFEDSDGNMKQFELYDNISEFIQNYEESKDKKKKSKEQKLLIDELVLGSEDENSDIR